MRHNWRLINNCCSVLVDIISNTIPMYDMICKRSSLFATQCLHSSQMSQNMSYKIVFMC